MIRAGVSFGRCVALVVDRECGLLGTFWHRDVIVGAMAATASAAAAALAVILLGQHEQSALQIVVAVFEHVRTKTSGSRDAEASQVNSSC